LLRDQGDGMLYSARGCELEGAIYSTAKDGDNVFPETGVREQKKSSPWVGRHELPS